MNKHIYKNGVSHLVMKYEDAISDPKLKFPGNNGRKFLVNEIYPEKEEHIQSGLDQDHPEFVVWKANSERHKVPILEVGYGGMEVATFTEQAKQDRHKHLKGTECYTILQGRMKIRVNDREIELREKDEIIILPGTIHEIVPGESNFVTRVHFINGYGIKDKYIEVDGKWMLVREIK